MVEETVSSTTQQELTVMSWTRKTIVLQYISAAASKAVTMVAMVALVAPGSSINLPKTLK